MSVFILCIGLEESDVTVIPSATSMNWLRWWCSPLLFWNFTIRNM